MAKCTLQAMLAIALAGCIFGPSQAQLMTTGELINAQEWRSSANPFVARNIGMYASTYEAYGASRTTCSCQCECDDNFEYETLQTCRQTGGDTSSRICEPYVPISASKPKPRPRPPPSSSPAPPPVHRDHGNHGPGGMDGTCCANSLEYATLLETVKCSNTYYPDDGLECDGGRCSVGHCRRGEFPDLEDNLENVDAVLDNAYGADFSPDGKFYYVASAGNDVGSVQLDDSLTVFNVNTTTGMLSWVQTMRDSGDRLPADPNTHGLGLRDVRHVKVSPNGQWAYATSTEDQSLSVFNRSETTGALTWQHTFWDQNSEAAMFLDFIDDDDLVDGLDTPWDIDFSVNGTYIYVAGGGDHEVAIFSQPSVDHLPHYVGFRKTNRALSGDSQGCYIVDDEGVNVFAGVWNPTHISVSPTNEFLVVSGSTSHNFALFAINNETGLLTCAEVVNYYGGSDILAFKYIPVPEYEETRSIYDDYPHSGTDDSNDGRGSLYDDYPRNDDDDSGGYFCYRDVDGGEMGALGDSVEEDVEACKAQCVSTASCATISFYASTGRCRLNSECVETKASNSDGLVYNLGDDGWDARRLADDKEKDNESVFIYSLSYNETKSALAVFEVRHDAQFLADYSTEEKLNNTRVGDDDDDDDGCSEEDCGGNPFRKIELIQVLDDDDVEPFKHEALALDVAAGGCSAYVSLYTGNRFVEFTRDADGYLEFTYTAGGRQASQSFSILHHPWANFIYQTSQDDSSVSVYDQSCGFCPEMPEVVCQGSFLDMIVWEVTKGDNIHGSSKNENDGELECEIECETSFPTLVPTVVEADPTGKPTATADPTAHPTASPTANPSPTDRRRLQSNSNMTVAGARRVISEYYFHSNDDADRRSNDDDDENRNNTSYHRSNDDDDDDATTTFSIDTTLGQQTCCWGVCRTVSDECSSTYASALCCTAYTPAPTMFPDIEAEVSATFSRLDEPSPEYLWPTIVESEYAQAFSTAAEIYSPNYADILHVDIRWQIKYLYKESATLSTAQAFGIWLTFRDYLNEGAIEPLTQDITWVIGEPIYEDCVIPTASPTTSPTAFPGDDVRRLEGASQLDTDRGLEEALQQQRLLQGGNRRGGATLLQGPVSVFNCDAHPFPIQILKGSEDLYYSVNELNIRSNEYDFLYNLEQDELAGKDVNGISLWQSVDYGESTIIGAVGTPGEDDWQLCALDGVAVNCLGNENWVKLDTTNGNPNSGLTIGNMYLYGSGKINCLILDINTNNPRKPISSIEGEGLGCFDIQLPNAFYDATDVIEYQGRHIETIEDGMFASYVLGLSGAKVNGKFQLVLSVLRFTDIEDPTADDIAYAIFPGVTFAGYGDSPYEGAAFFGAAFTYYGSGAPRVFFTENNGWGMFELELPFTAPERCWITADGMGAPVDCYNDDGSSIPKITKIIVSAITSKNDGMNCRDKGLPLGPGFVPICTTITYETGFMPDVVSENVAILQSSEFQDALVRSTGVHWTDGGFNVMENEISVTQQTVHYKVMVAELSDLEPINAPGFNETLLSATNALAAASFYDVQIGDMTISTFSPTAPPTDVPTPTPTTPRPTIGGDTFSPTPTPSVDECAPCAAAGACFDAEGTFQESFSCPIEECQCAPCFGGLTDQCIVPPTPTPSTLAPSADPCAPCVVVASCFDEVGNFLRQCRSLEGGGRGPCIGCSECFGGDVAQCDTFAPTAGPTATPTTADPTPTPTSAPVDPTSAPTPVPTVFECCEEVPQIAAQFVCNVDATCSIDGVETSDVPAGATTNIFDAKLSPDGDWLFTTTTKSSEGMYGTPNPSAQNSITVWSVDGTTKDLTWVQTIVGGIDDVPAEALQDVGYLALSPAMHVVVAVSYGVDGVSSFTFDQDTGMLTYAMSIYDKKSITGLGTVNGLDGVRNAHIFGGLNPTSPTEDCYMTASCDDGSEVGFFSISPTAIITFRSTRNTQRENSNHDSNGCFNSAGSVIKGRNPSTTVFDPLTLSIYVSFEGNDVVGVYEIVNNVLACRQMLSTNAPLPQHQIVFGDATCAVFVDGFVYVIGYRLAYLTILKQDPDGIYGPMQLDMLHQYQENDGSAIGNALFKPVHMTVTQDGCTVYASQTRGVGIIMMARDWDTGDLSFISTLNPLNPSDASSFALAVHPHGDLFVPIQDENALVVVKDSCPDIIIQPLSYQAQALGGVKKGTESSGIKGMPDGKNTSLSAMELSSILVAVSLLVVLVQLYSADLRSPSQANDASFSSANEIQCLTEDNGQTFNYQTENDGNDHKALLSQF